MVHPKLSRIRYLAISREIPAEITRNQVTKSANTIKKKKEPPVALYEVSRLNSEENF